MRRLEHVQLNVFALTMGLAGLSLAWRRASLVMGFGSEASAGIAWAATALFALSALALAGRLARHSKSVLTELRHPIKFPFLAAVTVAVLLVATALVPLAPALATGLWWVGALAHLAVTTVALGRWLRGGVQFGQVLPTWLIPLVGNIVAPIAGVKLGSVGLSWFMFGLGLTLWITLLPVIVGRYLVHGHPQPARLAPVIVILVAPPSVALVSLDALVPGAAATPVGFVLLAAGWTFLLVALSQVDVLAKTPFGLPWWAVSFPLAALSAATTSTAATVPGLVGVAWAMLATASVVIAALFALTLVALLRGRLFLPEPPPATTPRNLPT